VLVETVGQQYGLEADVVLLQLVIEGSDGIGSTDLEGTSSLCESGQRA
jgi:hypothetical protein